MLQIISGKFFTSEERFRHQAKGITFANYAWVQPIETCIATLEPVDTYASVASYVINYINQLEKEKPPKKDILIRTGDAEIVEQFQLLCTFGLKAFFHQDRDTVAVTCREQKLSSSDHHVPSAFVPRFFLKQIRGTTNEIESFISFVEKVIGLRREVYCAVIASLRNFANALQILGHNIDLAYSLIIYSLESLSQSFDAYDAKWDDYYEDVRADLDVIFESLPKKQAEKIRSTLLKASNLKLVRRFTEFISSHIDDSFFIDEAPGGYGALKRSELAFALRNAYYMRSKYAHKLEPIQQQLKHPHTVDSDVIQWENQPYLSMAGLVRLAHHSIMRFVERQPNLKYEEWNWRKELPGMLQMELSPEYWVWKHEGLRQEHATMKLYGFLSQLEGVLVRGTAFTDLKTLLGEYERLLPTSKRTYQLRLFALYCLYNLFLKEKDRCQNYKKIIDDYVYLFENCSIEAAITLLLLEKEWPWPIDECITAWKQYANQRFQRTGLRIPVLFEVALLNEFAKMFLKNGDSANYIQSLEMAILDSAGKKELQNLLKEAITGTKNVSFQEIIEAEKK